MHQYLVYAPIMSSLALDILVQAAEQVSINNRPYSPNTKNASPGEFFPEGTVHHVIAKAFLTCSERGYVFVHWKNDLSQTLNHWQGFIQRYAENNEPMRKQAVAIVGEIRKHLIFKAMDTNSWFEFYAVINSVIGDILKRNQSSSNEIDERGIDEFAKFVQKKFNTYYRIGLNLKQINRYL